MKHNRHSALMTVIVPDVIHLIAERRHLDEVTATRAFLSSRTYAALEDEYTGVWHYSPETLYLMFAGELDSGYVTFPEGA